MVSKSDFRIIIVGGGIAGLTLAIELQQADIDFLLLERRDVVDPQVGASIGIVPQGLRILDQLGCYDDVDSLVEPLSTAGERWEDGSEITPVSDFGRLLKKRFGYATAFLDRQMILRVLYSHINDKSKVLLQKEIVKIVPHTDSVTAYCSDGTSYVGDVLAGCDGVHSKVRKEMWRNADESNPGYIPSSDKTAISAEYECMFGISNPVPGLEKGHVDAIYMDGKSILNIVSKDYRIYWFAFKKYPKRLREEELPHPTPADADVYARDFLHVGLRPGRKVTFGHVWDQKISNTLVPLEEAEYQKWSWRRIACIGDSIHKCTPDAGQGGNAAIESATAFSNQIYMLVQKHKSTGIRPSLEDIEQALKAYQTTREVRVPAILKTANSVTRLRARKTAIDRFVTRYIMPYMGDVLADMFSGFVIGGERLDYLSLPVRSVGSMPFNPFQGVGRTESRLKRAALMLPFLFIVAAATHTMSATKVFPELEKVVIQGKITWNENSVSTIKTFLGIKVIDDWINLSTIGFSQAILGIDQTSSWQAFLFVVDFTGIFSIVLIESCRRVNFATIFQLPFIIIALVQFFGIGIVIPIYWALLWTFNPIEKFAAADSRLTDVQYSTGVLPAMLVGYLLPHFLSNFHPSLQSRIWWNAVWQLFPIWAAITMYTLAKTHATPNTVKHDRLNHTERDIPVIRRTLQVLTIISAGVWWYTIIKAPISIINIFFPQQWNPQAAQIDFSRNMLQYSQIWGYGSSLLYVLYSFHDLKRAGMLDRSCLNVFATGLLLMGLLGPGAVFNFAWLYREELLASRRHKDAVTLEKLEYGASLNTHFE